MGKSIVAEPTPWPTPTPQPPQSSTDPGTSPPGTSDATTGATPKGNKADWIREEDYPSAALRAVEEGAVTISVAISAEGRVSGCTVTGSSGHAALDQATCRLYALRARYAPARDASGTPVPTTLTDHVRWQIPR
jgi:protein TonB